MSKDKARIGIIGVGQIGKVHLNNYAKMNDVEVVAACDIDLPELDRVCEMHKIPNKYEKFRDLLQRDDIEAVDVCVHNNLHSPITIAALEAGKNVFCEKPMAGRYVDAEMMYETAQTLGRKLSIQLGLLFSPETRAAKRLIEDGHLGKLYHARSTGYRRRGRPYVDGYGSENFVKMHMSGGGALFDMGVYHISQILYLLGMPTVQHVTGRLYQETDMDPVRREKSGYEVEELGVGFVRFDGGLTMDIIEAWAIHMGPFEGSSIAGNKGGVRFNPLSFHSTSGDLPMDAMPYSLKEADTRWHSLDELETAYDSPQHHWIAVLRERVPLLPTAEIALQTMLISEGIRLSGELGREVSAEEIKSMSKSMAHKL